MHEFIQGVKKGFLDAMHLNMALFVGIYRGIVKETNTVFYQTRTALEQTEQSETASSAFRKGIRCGFMEAPRVFVAIPVGAAKGFAAEAHKAIYQLG